MDSKMNLEYKGRILTVSANQTKSKTLNEHFQHAEYFNNRWIDEQCKGYW